MIVSSLYEVSVPQMNQIANLIFGLFLLLIGVSLHAHEQLLLVTAETMDSPTAALQRYTRQNGKWHAVGTPVKVNLGRNGLGWGLGKTFETKTADDPQKHEGDGRAPAGIFALGSVFGYAASNGTSMPYLQAAANLICIDDGTAPDYNKLVPITARTETKSFEWMRREDGLYRVGVVVKHNASRIPGRGSCIFLHVEKAPHAPTSGCTSMPESALRTLIAWLDAAKAPLLVQIPRKSLPDARRRFPGIEE